MLECSDFKVYVQSAPTHLGAGIETPSIGRNKALPCSVYFFACSFWRAVWRLFGAPSLSTGSFNSVQPAILLIETNDGSFQKSTEATIMDDVRYAVWLFSQLSDEDQQFILIFLQTWIEFKRSKEGKL